MEQTAEELSLNRQIGLSRSQEGLYIKLMVAALTKDGLEAEVVRVASRFHEDQHGCKADVTSAHVVDDLVIVRSSGCFTPTELNLVKTDDGRKIGGGARVGWRGGARGRGGGRGGGGGG